jgi:hypothetical protein
MSNPCRLCQSTSTVEVLDFGDLAFTGTFPASATERVPNGRLALMVCPDCGLVQLADEFPPSLLYGQNYGYRSGLNAGMVRHLTSTAKALQRRAALQSGDVVLDIGSNDGTLLGAYTVPGVGRIGIDPTSAKFAEFHPPGILAVEEFFTADAFWKVSDRPARIVTSIAMFYDLPDPVAFARDVARCLADDGLWHLEVAYAPKMLASGAYDGICHEHLEYYTLTTLAHILDLAGLTIVDVSTNTTNGGSIAVTAGLEGFHTPEFTMVPWLLARESRARVGDPLSWMQFGARVRESQSDLLGLLSSFHSHGATIGGLGASTKGNVLLQTSGIGTALISGIGDVNPYKYGRVTPGTHIPIMSEADMLATDPDYLLVLPWHFRDGIVKSMESYLAKGGRLIFPLPDIEVVGS